MQKHTILFSKILNITLIINIEFLIQRRVVFAILRYVVLEAIAFTNLVSNTIYRSFTHLAMWSYLHIRLRYEKTLQFREAEPLHCLTERGNNCATTFVEYFTVFPF